MEICKVEKCRREVQAKGLCKRHYAQIYRLGKIIKNHFDDNPRKRSKCKVEGCKREHLALGYCSRHYAQIQRTGAVYKSQYDLGGNRAISKGRITYILLGSRKNIRTKLAIISSEDYDRIKKYTWHADGNGYAGSIISGEKIYLHHFIMGSAPDRHQQRGVDHKNRNKLDNRRSNLRFCTRSQNNMNSKIRADNKSGVKGVYWYKRKQRWHVQIRFHGKQHHLGYFCNLAQAAVVRRKAELKYFGEFAPVELP